VTDSNVPGAKGQEVRWDAAQPLALQTTQGKLALPAAQLAPLLAPSPANLDGLLAEAATHVQGEEIVQRDGAAVALFSITGTPAGDVKVGFPLAGGATLYVEGADQLAVVVSAR